MVQGELDSVSLLINDRHDLISHLDLTHFLGEVILLPCVQIAVVVSVELSGAGEEV